MKLSITKLILFTVLYFPFMIYSIAHASTNTKNSPYALLRSVELDAVHWTGGFMYDQWFQCRDVMIPGQWERWDNDNVSHAFENFLIASGLHSGIYRGTAWLDGDFYKWMESASFMLAQTHNPALDNLLDSIIVVIGMVQQADGYIYTKNIINGTPTHISDNFGAEMYSCGHLLSAAAVHHRATGKSDFLNIAIKLADHLVTFYPTHTYWYWDHTLIMGLVELYRETGTADYLDLAWTIVDTKGNPAYPWLQDNSQDRVPFREEIYAVGHAQRANYLYAGAADVIAEKEDQGFYNTLTTIWDDVVNRKMYITGGCGALHEGESPYSPGVRVTEAYGPEYYLPNTSAYNENCAQIGNVLWNWRMLTLTGDAKYADIIELELFNAISGISRDGKNFFYTNVLRRVVGEPLLSMDLPTRTPTSGSSGSYTDCQCCPPNLIRMISMAQDLAYSISDDKRVWVNLYGSNTINATFKDATPLELTQSAPEYPWGGSIQLTVNTSNTFGIMMRMPGWATEATLTVNGHPEKVTIVPGEYTEISNRSWSSGDVIEIEIPMPVRLIENNPLVTVNIGKVSVKRGPIVYCVESVDLPSGVGVDDLLIPNDIQLTPRYDSDLLGGVTVLEGNAFTDMDSLNITMIPYYAWSNRGVSSMRVWMNVYDVSNLSPTASFIASPTSGDAPLVVNFDASGSSDPDEDNLSYSWDFGDGSISTEQNPTHTYTWESNYTVILTVYDGRGGVDTAMEDITVTFRKNVLFDFENEADTTQGFEDACWFPGCLVILSRIADPTGRSNGVLALECDASLSDRATIQVWNVDPQNAFAIGYYIYLPSDFPNEGLISVWGDDNVNGWNWNASNKHGHDLSKKTWAPVYFHMEEIYQQDSSNFNPYGSNYLKNTGVQFYFGNNSTWSGTIYIDDCALIVSDTSAGAVEKEDLPLPLKTQLYANFPNPFNPTTSISYDLRKDSHVSLVIYNLLGQKIKTLWNRQKPAGHHSIRWDGTNDTNEKVTCGIYLYTLKADDFYQTRKMILIK